MRGPYARGLDPSQAMGLSLRPTAMIPKVFPGLSGASPFYGLLSELPAAQLAPLMRRGYDGGPSDLANATGRFYQHAGADMSLPDTNQLLRNLGNPRGGGGIDDMFGGVRVGKGDQESYSAPGFVYGQEPLPAGSAASTVQGMLDAIFTSTLPAPTATAASAYANYLVDKGTARVMKRPAGHGRSLNEVVGRRFKF